MSDQPASLVPVPEGYADWLADLKSRVYQAQQRAAQKVNTELVLLYWQIGQDIHQRMEDQGYGGKVVDRLAHDLRSAFPDMKGFSARNLRYMRAFAQVWPDQRMLQQVVARLPWSHNVVLLNKLEALRPGVYEEVRFSVHEVPRSHTKYADSRFQQPIRATPTLNTAQH